MKLNILKNKLLFCILSAVIISTLVSVAFSLGMFKVQSDRLSDAIYTEKNPFPDIILIAIDDKSINDIGRWPWSRSVFADALDRLKDAKVIGIDVSFLEPESNQTDSLLQSKIDGLKGKIVLVSECSEFEEMQNISQHGLCKKWLSPIFNAKTGAANVFSDNGITRAIPSKIDNLTSFSKLVAERYLNKNMEMIEKNYIRFSRFKRISFSDLMNSTEDFNGKIVLIGATAQNLHDFKETPIGTLSGVEVHASAVQTEITGSFLGMQSRTSIILWIFALSVLTSLILWRLKLPLATILSLSLIAAYPVIAIFRFDSGTVYSLLYPESSVILTYFTIIGVYYIIEARQRKWVSSVLGKYVSDEVAKQILEKGEEALNLKGKKKTVTILFSDVRGFTSMSEKMEPEEVVSILNRYLSRMTDIVFENKGTLDKYVGDEIMATYNVPLDLEDHAIHAVKTAIEMQKAARNIGKELKYGIGINTGEAIVGNIGSKKRLDYTVIGDSVNLAARLCGKAEPDQILISESTYKLIKGIIEARSIGEIQVKGKEKPIRVYEVVY